MKRRKRSKPDGDASAAPLGNSISADGDSSGQVSSSWTIVLAAGLIVVAAVAAYSNSLQCPFVFDDENDIIDNASIQHLWPIQDVFVAQQDGRSCLRSRPVVNLSLAVNYMIGGLDTFAYHATNLFVHVLAGWTLFGIVRRTLLLPSLGGRFAASATALGLAVALIWTLHPLQTGALTYVTQRYESMMGLFYLLALYAAVRCGTSEHPGRWAVASVAATLLALGCKEVAVSIPITILLYDRAFLAGSFREAWRRRWGMYVGLAAAWAPFVALQLSSSGRGSWAGYGLPVTWIEYARSQFGVILHYLRLAFWPCPLVLDYDWPVARTAGKILPGAAAIGGLAAATAYALIRRPKWGFVGAWFFLILAPTSSVFPLRDLAFEHRMYLPLAAVVTSVVMGGWIAGQWLVRRRMISLPVLQAVGGVLVTCAGVALAVLTFERNADYRSNVSIWQDVVAKVPDNARAHNNLGTALAKCGRLEDAIAHCRTAVAICPDYAEAHSNLGMALARGGYVDEAIAQYRQVLKIAPNNFRVMNNLAWARATNPEASFRNGAEAVTWAQRAIELTGGRDPIVLDTLAAAQAEAGQFAEAVKTAQQALALATSQNNAALAESIHVRLKLYQSGTPFRETRQLSDPKPSQP